MQYVLPGIIWFDPHTCWLFSMYNSPSPSINYFSQSQFIEAFSPLFLFFVTHVTSKLVDILNNKLCYAYCFKLVLPKYWCNFTHLVKMQNVSQLTIFAMIFGISAVLSITEFVCDSSRFFELFWKLIQTQKWCNRFENQIVTKF